MNALGNNNHLAIMDELMLDTNATLNLTETGQTWWSLVASSSGTCAHLELTCDPSQPEKGFGVVAHKRPFKKASLVFSNYAVAAVLTNWKDSEICMHCFQLINKSAKCSTACRHLRFCSNDCLRANDAYILRCGKAVNQLVKKNSSFPIESQVLALNLLHRLTVASDADEVQQLLYIFQLHCRFPQNKGNEEIFAAADAFHGILTNSAPQLLAEVQWFLKFDPDKARQLFQLIRLNAQPMFIYGSKRHSILCLLPTIARINHSCRPNCELVLQIEEEGSRVRSDCGRSTTTSSSSSCVQHFARQLSHSRREVCRPRRLLRVSVLATADIAQGAELRISYLTNLYESSPGRQHFLQEGFFFQCRCARCLSELSLDHCPAPAPGSASNLMDRIVARQRRLESVLAATMQLQHACLELRECEEIVSTCEGLMADISCAQREDGLAWSPTSVYHACLLVIDDYQGRFRRLQAQAQWREYVAFGLLFYRAGKLMCDCWAQVQCPSRPARLDLMTKVSLHSALTAKPFLEHRADPAIAAKSPAEKVAAMVKGALAMSVETVVIIDTVYLNNEAYRERESEVGTDDSLTLGDTWHYMRLLRDKAIRVRSYLRTALDRLNEG
jgi:hypothetical protein